MLDDRLAAVVDALPDDVERVAPPPGGRVNNPDGYPPGTFISRSGVVVRGPVHHLYANLSVPRKPLIVTVCGRKDRPYVFRQVGGLRATVLPAGVTCEDCLGKDSGKRRIYDGRPTKWPGDK